MLYNLQICFLVETAHLGTYCFEVKKLVVRPFVEKGYITKEWKILQKIAYNRFIAFQDSRGYSVFLFRIYLVPRLLVPETACDTSRFGSDMLPGGGNRGELRMKKGLYIPFGRSRRSCLGLLFIKINEVHFNDLKTQI